jgi:hypothetical protein
MRTPIRVRLTEHAFDRLSAARKTSWEVEQVILSSHHKRRWNHGRGQWRITKGDLVIIYDWPDHGDSACAKLVTVWRHNQ